MHFWYQPGITQGSAAVCEDDEARWVHALTPAHRTLGWLAQSRALLEDEPTGEALRRLDTQALAAMPERARYVLEVAEDFFFADPDTRREVTSRERALFEYLPERRPYRCVSLGQLVSAWLFRQWVHLGSMPGRGAGSHHTTLATRKGPPTIFSA